MTPMGDGFERFAGHQYPQVVPTPEVMEPGALAPWSALSPTLRRSLSLERVRTALSHSRRLLGEHAPPAEPEEISLIADALPAPVTRRSAVLVALFEEDAETHVILTRRALTLRHHRGEIAFPGGRCEGDETLVATALREAHEEIGLLPSLVSPLGWLSPIVSFASSSSIWPIVALLKKRPVLTIDPVEVERVFTVSLADLVADGAFVEERWRRAVPRPGGDEEGFFPIYFFKVPGDLIWGATARVLTELLSLVTGAR